MKKGTITLVLVLCAGTISAQPPGVRPAINWQAAHQAIFGTNAGTQWLQELEVDDLEVYTTGDGTLVLVDRTAAIQHCRPEGLLGPLYQGLGGTDMRRVGPAERTDGQVWLGTYRGTLSGNRAEMRQYVQVSEGQPVALIRIITPGTGSAIHVQQAQEPVVAHLLGEPLGTERTALADR